MSFRITCMEVPTDTLDLSTDISVRELQFGSEPLPRHLWVDPDTSTIYWSKSRQADKSEDSVSLSIPKIIVEPLFRP